MATLLSIHKAMGVMYHGLSQGVKGYGTPPSRVITEANGTHSSTEAMSGFADPARTATPIPTRARGTACWGDLALLDEVPTPPRGGHRDIHDLTADDAPPDLGGPRVRE